MIPAFVIRPVCRHSARPINRGSETVFPGEAAAGWAQEIKARGMSFAEHGHEACRAVSREIGAEQASDAKRAIVSSIIAFMDRLDGDCEDEGAQCDDEGGQCEDKGAQCDDEGAPDDNELADIDGAAGQGWRSVYGGYVR